MSDTIMNKTARATICVAVLIFCMGMMAWLVAYGDPKNLIHQSAFTWCGGIIGLIIISLSIVDGVQYLAVMKK